jgi:hypothetical protein
MTVAVIRIRTLSDEVTGLLARIPATEFSTTDDKITTAEGARFNRDMAQMPGSEEFNRFWQASVHNPFLMEALLLASIKQIEIDYGITPSPALSMERQLLPGQLQVKER